MKKSNSLKDFLTLTHRIMHLALQGLLRVDFLHDTSKILMEFSACDSVEMWLRERGKFYRSEVKRATNQPFYFEIMSSGKDKQGRVIPDFKKCTCFEKICQDVFIGEFDPALSFFTKNGSFWTGRAENSFAAMAEKGKKAYSDYIPKKTGYKSLAVLPISVENQKMGLLQLKSNSADFFRKEEIEFYEAVVQSMGIALMHRRAQVELRERVKELTCLYGIAKIVEHPDISLQEILQEVVELIPPAWLYPDIASTRIILDEDVYSTAHFQESYHKQSADIVVEGKKRGVIEVFYSQEKPELDEGPFLREERILIDTIAREIALIIERKQTDEDRNRLQEQLRHADRLATIGQLSAGVAHELNEPIGSILGFSQLINKRPDLPEQIKQDVEKIVKASLHAREVVKKLMLFARQTPPKKTQVNLNQLVEEGIYFLESRLAKEGIKLVRSLAKDIPEVTADSAQLTQVLVNIVVNAIQAMPKGGKLSIQTKSSDNSVLLIIQDTGVGISESEKEKIFLPFFTTKDVGQGTGLGLAVVHGIVTSHGGSIQVDSKKGRGARFEIRIPIKEFSDAKKRGNIE